MKGYMENIRKTRKGSTSLGINCRIAKLTIFQPYGVQRVFMESTRCPVFAW
jgi:hypothetical protein